MAKRIIVCGAGGAPAVNFIRSLRKAREKFFLIGVTCNKYDLAKAKGLADRVFLVPTAKDRYYFPVLSQIINETHPEFLHAQNDEEVFEVSRNRDELRQLGVNTFLPRHEIVSTCQDKFACAKIWTAAGLKVPKTFLICNYKDLEAAFRKIKGRSWIRANSGAFGKWSLPTSDINFARIWIDYYKGWGKVSAAEYLSPDSITWLSIWKDGELVVAQARKRLYWEFANRSVSGVTGITGTGLTVSDKDLDKLAQKAIFAVDKKPNGIYGVDLTYDRKGIPNPTEINIGRFFTTHQFFTDAGLNMPYFYVRLAYGERMPRLIRKISPLKEGLAWVRGMDVEPVLTTLSYIQSLEESLERRIQRVNSSRSCLKSRICCRQRVK